VLTKKQIQGRLSPAAGHNIPLSNYGMAIAFMQGIFDRAVRPFIGTKARKHESTKRRGNEVNK
ncbi:MAG: hypothetical protein LBU83_06485, partial [Bacteroidales bacterium]|nr:hypothetical protein [Bacteroidales bacterium]